MKVTMNSALSALNNSKVGSDLREALVKKGSILALETVARAHNAALEKAGKSKNDYGSAFNSTSVFNAEKAKCSDDILFFCAEKVNSFAGLATDRNDRSTFTDPLLATNGMYLSLLSGIVSEIQYAITPALVNELVGEMCSVITVPKGKTAEIEVTSNAVIKWEDSSWTSLRSVPRDKLYNRAVTVNPRPIATRFEMDYYQMIGNNGNLIDTIAAVAGGYAAKVMEKFTTAFTAAAANTKYVPSALAATSYTDANWAAVIRNVAAANRVRRDQLIAYGDFLALRKVLPDNATLASAIMTMLGDEYFTNGFLMSHDGVRLYEIAPTSTPETINTTMTPVWPTSTIVIAARANQRYAPMIFGVEEGGEGRITLTPGDDVIATGKIQGLSYASIDIEPCFASRIGIITNVM